MKKFKGIMAIAFLSLSFFMMTTTKYTHALGDYVLEFIGLQSWTGEYSGFHLGIIYFGALSIIGLIMIRKYSIEELGMRKRYIFLLFIIFVTIFSSITDRTVENIKKHSKGLRAIGLNYENSKMSYQSKDMKYTEFTAQVELTNYSDEKKRFYMSIDRPQYREEGEKKIEFYTLGGNRAVFELHGNETKVFIIDLNQYIVTGGELYMSGAGRSNIIELILTDEEGNSIILDKDNFIGIELRR